MSLHLIKLAVGVDDLDHLRRIQLRRLEEHGRIFHRTRMAPKRVAELTGGGSIYWVMRRLVTARQRILGLERDTDAEGRRFCLLVLDPRLVATESRPQRPFQGWRYLNPDDAPPDRDDAGAQPPPEMLAELRRLGLW